ncbi:MAG: class I SAM-dependent methyltransferase [Dehalococcoidales bacterium]|nr:class I SAM-dependent methyltransferase [Dehalococcoidales bacterium]
MEKELFRRVAQPHPGQTLLEIGCGTGHNLEFFRELGLSVAGIDASEPMCQIAAGKLGPECRILRGDAGKLSFPDESFDIVVLITVLEFCSDPAAVVREAGRLARDKIYIGFLNRASLLGTIRRIEGKFRPTIYRQSRFYTLPEIRDLIEREIGPVTVDWDSILFFPLGWHRYCRHVDRRLSFRHTPGGGFVGVCATKSH